MMDARELADRIEREPLPQLVTNVDRNEKADAYRLIVSDAERKLIIAALRSQSPAPEGEARELQDLCFRLRETNLSELQRELVAKLSALALPQHRDGVSLDQVVAILQRRADGYRSRWSAIFNGVIIADELEGNIREIRALKGTPS